MNFGKCYDFAGNKQLYTFLGLLLGQVSSTSLDDITTSTSSMCHILLFHILEFRFNNLGISILLTTYQDLILSGHLSFGYLKGN